MKNKLIVLGIVFVLVFTLNVFSNNSHASTSPIYEWPITITNNQNISTPNPFQQLIHLSISSLNQQLASANIHANIIFTGKYGNNGLLPVGTGTFANFEFTYSNGQLIPAWIEDNASGALLIWLKLSSIPAKSSITIYLDIFSSTTNMLSSSGTIGIGESPLYSPVYGEYDDGSSVFDFYDNFVGKSLNGNNWVYGGSGSIIVNNSAYLKTISYVYIMTSYGFNPYNTIADVYAGQATANAPDVAFSMTVGNLNTSNGYFWLDNSYNKFSNGSYAKGGYYIGTNTNGFISGNTESESWYSSIKHVYITDYGYSDVAYENQTFNSYSIPSQVYYGVGLQYSSNGYINTTWFRVRAFPPYGIMPSVYISSPLTVSVSFSSNSNSTSNNIIVINNSTSNNLQFNSQYFSFMIDSVFYIYFIIFICFIFSIYMAVAIVRKRR